MSILVIYFYFYFFFFFLVLETFVEMESSVEDKFVKGCGLNGIWWILPFAICSHSRLYVIPRFLGGLGVGEDLSCFW